MGGGMFPLQHSLAENASVTVANPNFTNVVVQNSMDVKIKCGDAVAIEIPDGEADIDDLSIKTKGEVLTIAQENSGFVFFKVFDFINKPKVSVTVPPKGQILSISASGSSDVVFYQCAVNDQLIALNAVGSSSLKGSVDSRAARIYVAESSYINVSGTLKGLNLQVFGSSNFNTELPLFEKLIIRDVRLKMGGSSNAQLCNTHDIIGEIAGSSDLVYGYTYNEKPRILRIKATGSSKQTPKHCGR